MFEVLIETTDSITTINIGASLKEGFVYGRVSLDNQNSDYLHTLIEKELAKGNVYILLNLKNISYLYSYGLGNIIDLYKQAKANGGNLKILSPSNTVEKMFTALKISSLIETVYNKEEAIEHFFKT